MDNKKLIEVIKLIVEKEVKKQLPKIIKEEVLKQVKLLEEATISKNTKFVEDEIYDPFEMANTVLESNRVSVEPHVNYPSTKKIITKNKILNEVLLQTKPFTSQQRNGGVGEEVSILDNFKQPINEVYHDYEEWPTMNHNLQPRPGIESVRNSMRTQMEEEMGIRGSSKKGGLGVTTGLAGLDRILNRDNSELVKRFKR